MYKRKYSDFTGIDRKPNSSRDNSMTKDIEITLNDAVFEFDAPKHVDFSSKHSHLHDKILDPQGATYDIDYNDENDVWFTYSHYLHEENEAEDNGLPFQGGQIPRGGRRKTTLADFTMDKPGASMHRKSNVFFRKITERPTTIPEKKSTTRRLTSINTTFMPPASVIKETIEEQPEHPEHERLLKLAQTPKLDKLAELQQQYNPIRYQKQTSPLHNFMKGTLSFVAKVQETARKMKEQQLLAQQNSQSRIKPPTTRLGPQFYPPAHSLVGHGQHNPPGPNSRNNHHQTLKSQPRGNNVRVNLFAEFNAINKENPGHSLLQGKAQKEEGFHMRHASSSVNTGSSHGPPPHKKSIYEQSKPLSRPIKRTGSAAFF